MHGAQQAVARRRKPSLPVLESALAAVMSGGVPDVSGDDTLGLVEVVDPFEEAEWLDGRRASRPHKVKKVQNLRGDPLGLMHARRQLNSERGDDGEARYQAGRQWQRDYEAAEISNLRAIDFTRDVVDGGKLADPMSDRRTRAMAALARYDKALGPEGFHLVRDVLGRRLFIHEVVRARGYSGRERTLNYYADRFRECLETLAKEMNFVTKRR
jgi:hypothetical protein